MLGLEKMISRRVFIQRTLLGAGMLASHGCDSKEKMPTGPEPALEQIENIVGKHIGGAALYLNDKFHFFGGDAIWSCIHRARDIRHEIFDIETGKVSSGGGMLPTLASAASYVYNDQLFALGGLLKDSDPAPGDLTLYPGELTDIVMSRYGNSNSWEYTSRFPRKIHSARGLVLNDKPHIFGGCLEDKVGNPYMWVLENGEWSNIAKMNPVLSVLSNTIANSKIYAIAYQDKKEDKKIFDTRYEYLLVFDGKKFEARLLPKRVSDYNRKHLFTHDDQLYLFAYDFMWHREYQRSALFTYSERKGWQKSFVFKIPEKLEHYPFKLFHGGAIYLFGKDHWVEDSCGYRIQLVPFLKKANANV